jgi:hypothetical protein
MSCRCQIGDSEGNLSVAPRIFTTMTKTAPADKDKDTVFDDPVAYLADHGISAELVADTTLPAAA